MPVEEQVVSIFAGTRGFLDGLQVSQVGKFEKAVLGEIKAKHPQVLEAIRTEREISKATDAKLTEILAAFAKTFA
jgi:F-type H+-transporting ATPase subunit alpha